MTALAVNGDVFAISVEGGTVVVDLNEGCDRFFSCQMGKSDVQDGTISLNCCAVSAHHLVFCWHKELYLYDLPQCKLACKKELKRAASHVQFTENQIVLADKSGDVYLLDMKLENGHLLLGHVSMILDVLITPEEHHILTCDRDEKIRVSRFPNSYTIESFCLGHKEFVMTMTLLNHDPKLLVSGGGDGTLRIWDFIQGKQLLLHECNIPDTNEKAPAIIKIASVQINTESTLICTVLKNFHGIIVYKVSSSDSLKCVLHQVLPLDSEPIAMCLNRVGSEICVLNPEGRLILYQVEGDQVTCSSNGRVDKINASLDKHKNVLSNLLPTSTIVNSFYKKTFDNVEEYLKKKMDRLESANKRLKTDV